MVVREEGGYSYGEFWIREYEDFDLVPIGLSLFAREVVVERVLDPCCEGIQGAKGVCGDV